VHIDYFQKQLEDDDRLLVMAIFVFWTGVEADPQIGNAIRTAVSQQHGPEAAWLRGLISSFVPSSLC
jgi:hypothetical protein